jgi:hypothetical protein
MQGVSWMFKPFYFKLHCPAHPKIDQIGFPNWAAWPQPASSCLYCSGLFFQPLYRIYDPQPAKIHLFFDAQVHNKGRKRGQQGAKTGINPAFDSAVHAISAIPCDHNRRGIQFVYRTRT